MPFPYKFFVFASQRYTNTIIYIIDLLELEFNFTSHMNSEECRALSLSLQCFYATQFTINCTM